MDAWLFLQLNEFADKFVSSAEGNASLILRGLLSEECPVQFARFGEREGSVERDFVAEACVKVVHPYRGTVANSKQVFINDQLVDFCFETAALVGSMPPVILAEGTRIRDVPEDLRDALSTYAFRMSLLAIDYHKGEVSELNRKVLELRKDDEGLATMLGLGSAYFIVAHELSHLLINYWQEEDAHQEIIDFASSVAVDLVPALLKRISADRRSKVVRGWREEDFVEQWRQELAADLLALHMISRQKGFNDVTYMAAELMLLGLDIVEGFQDVTSGKLLLSSHPFACIRTQVLRSWLIKNGFFRWNKDVLLLPFLYEEHKNTLFKFLNRKTVDELFGLTAVLPEEIRTSVEGERVATFDRSRSDVGRGDVGGLP